MSMDSSSLVSFMLCHLEYNNIHAVLIKGWAISNAYTTTFITFVHIHVQVNLALSHYALDLNFSRACTLYHNFSKTIQFFV